MTTLKEIRLEVLDTLPDSRFSATWIAKQVNKCLVICAKRVKLPELEAVSTFETVVGTPFADIPVAWNYNHGLYAAEVDDAPDIEVLTSINLLRRHYPDAEVTLESGEIKYITTVKGQLFYYPIPAVITEVTCRYYENPTELSADTDEPTIIPEYLQELIINPYILWQMYKKVEDGADSLLINTRHHKKEFYEGLAMLEEDFEQGQSWVEPDRSTGYI